MNCDRCKKPLDEHRTAAQFTFCDDDFLTTSEAPYPSVDATDDGCSHDAEH
jgi:hypothetical protein